MAHYRDNERGLALLVVVMIAAVLLTTGVAAMRMTRNETRGLNRDVQKQQAFYVAEAGIQAALSRLATDHQSAAADDTYTATVTQSYGEGSFTATIDDDPAFSGAPYKLIRSVGTVGDQSSEVVANAMARATGGTTPVPTSVAETTAAPTATPLPTGGAPTATPTTGSTPTPQPTSTAAATPTPGGNPSANACDSMMASLTADVRIVAGNNTSGTIFNGELYAGDDVMLKSLLATALPNAEGNIWAKDDFYSLGLSVLTPLLTIPATLRYGGSYFSLIVNNFGAVVSADIHPFNTFGYHFSNGVNGHGVQTTIPDRHSPFPFDRKRLRETAVIIDGADTIPFGSWDSSTSTWNFNGANDDLIFPSDTKVTYYVRGNVDITDLHFGRNAKATIAAEGWVNIDTVNLFTTVGGVGGGANTEVATPLGGTAIGAGAVASVDAGSGQSLKIMARKKILLGWYDVSADWTLENETVYMTGGANVGHGLGMNVASLSQTNNILLYSEEEYVWAQLGTVDALNVTNVNICAHGDATLAFTQAVNSTIGRYYNDESR